MHGFTVVPICESTSTRGPFGGRYHSVPINRYVVRDSARFMREHAALVYAVASCTHFLARRRALTLVPGNNDGGASAMGLIAAYAEAAKRNLSFDVLTQIDGAIAVGGGFVPAVASAHAMMKANMEVLDPRLNHLPMGQVHVHWFCATLTDFPNLFTNFLQQLPHLLIKA